MSSPSPSVDRRPWPAWAFFAATFALSWGCWAPVAWAGWHTQDHPWGAALFLLGGFGPSVVGAVFLLAQGVTVGELVGRLVDPRRLSATASVVALGFYPVAFAAAALGVAALGGGWPGFDVAGAWWASGTVGLLGALGFVLVLGPLSEEIGWRGYAVDALEPRMGFVASSLVIGAAWWAWHLPLFALDGTLHESQGLLSFFAFGYLLTVLGYSVVFQWAYRRTRASVGLAVAAHFVVNGLIAGAAPFDGTIFVFATVVVLVVAGGLVAYLGPRGRVTEASCPTSPTASPPTPMC